MDILTKTLAPSVRNFTEHEGACAVYLPPSQLLSVYFYLLLAKKISSIMACADLHMLKLCKCSVEGIKDYNVGTNPYFLSVERLGISL